MEKYKEVNLYEILEEVEKTTNDLYILKKLYYSEDITYRESDYIDECILKLHEILKQF